jgi:pSer/pThr/pTyr-binding forkhead associated (FHA) protein
MVTLDEYQQSVGSQTAYSMSVSAGMISQTGASQTTPSERGAAVPPIGAQGLPVLTLYNQNLNIRIQGINGAVIGRRQGPYVQYFEQNMYISGVHAQLKYNGTVGWCIVDKHSSNGTKLNQHPLQPDVEMSLKSGDIVTLANVSLQVSINQ